MPTKSTLPSQILNVGTIKLYPRKSSHANQIHLMNWEGKLLAKYELDRDLSNIALDPSGRVVYGFAPEEQPKLVAYKLPSPLLTGQ